MPRTPDRLRRALGQHYERLKQHYLSDRAALVPREFRSSFVAYRGSAEVQYIVDKAIPITARRVLVIGVFGGRDYFFLKGRARHEVHAVDLEPRPHFDNFVAANIEVTLPYPDEFFDAIILNEVVEHLVHDAKALGNVRRILASNGVLLLSAPFLHEDEPTHVRVHTRTSILRLLGCCGFEATEVVERPGLGFYLPGVNELNFAASTLTMALAGRTAYEFTLPLLGALERWAGKHANPLRRLSPSWGAYFVCRKSEPLDYVEANRKDFARHGDSRFSGARSPH